MNIKQDKETLDTLFLLYLIVTVVDPMRYTAESFLPDAFFISNIIKLLNFSLSNMKTQGHGMHAYARKNLLGEIELSF